MSHPRERRGRTAAPPYRPPRRARRPPALWRRLLPLVAALALGAALAQGATCADLDAPFSSDVQEFARAVFAAMHEENRPGHVRQYVHLQGWPTVSWGNWEFQYPPTWVLRDYGMLHGWVSDARDASHLLFVIQDTTQGNPTVEGLFNGLLQATVGPHTPCDRVSFVASDATRRWYLAGAQGDVGMVYAWVFRWIDARFGPMIASLKLDIQARGMTTAYGYVFTSSPEAELSTVVQNAFGPMAATFRGSLGGPTEDKKPKKGKDGKDEDDDED